MKNFKYIAGSIFLFFFIISSLETKPQSSSFFNENKKIITSFKISDSLKILSKTKLIKNKYLKKGFINCSIDSIVKTKTGYNVFLYVGKKYFWNKINIIEDSNLLYLSKLKNKEADFFEIKNIIETQKQKLNNNGYPFAEVYISNYNIRDSLISLQIKIEKKNYIVFDSIYFDKKNVRVSEKYLQNYLRFKQNNAYNKQLIQKIDEKLQNTAFLELKSPSEIEFHPKSCDLYLYLKNKKTNNFSGILGFSNQNKKLSLAGKIELGVGNFFGSGDYYYFKWYNTKNQGQFLNTNISLPYILGTKLGIEEELAIKKKDTSYLHLDNLFTTKYFFSGSDNIGITYKYILSFPFSDDTTYKSFSTNYTGFSFTIDHRDDLFFTSKGILLNLTLQAGLKKENKNFEQRGLVSFAIDYFIPVTKNSSILLKNTTQSIIGKNIVANELLNFGGFNSIRGFEQDEFYATSFSIFTSEYRFLAGNRYIIYSFADYGFYIDTVVENIKNFKNLLGIGLGFSIKTKSGILSISYAIGKYENDNLNFLNSKLHFGLNSYF